MIRENIEPARDLPFGPSPTDVGFTTPAGKQGEGTHSRLNVGRYPISGFARMTPTNDLETLVVRLPPGQRRLVPVIIEAARRTWGRQ